MHLPRPKPDDALHPILPRRRKALEDPTVAWDLLDELHRLPGARGSAVATRMGRIVLSDVADEADRSSLESIARSLARAFREEVGQLGMGPLRMTAIQTGKSTVTCAPIGPGMLVTLCDRDVPLAHLRPQIVRVQDELGRVELAGYRTSGKQGAYDLPPIAVSDARPPRTVALDEVHPTEIVDECGVVMVFIPSGTFRMGSTESPDEQPVHEVTVSSFLIDKYPVTNEAYEAFLEGSPLWKPGSKNRLLLDEDYLAHWPNGCVPQAIAQHPVVWVSWWQVVKGYCAWRLARLPREAEWEFAGRGTDGRVYPWGTHWRPRRCNSYRLGAHWTSPVGEFTEGRSPFGVMDMSGNVWEWCADWYAPDWYRVSPRENPIGAPYGRARVLRGGSRFNHANYVKLTKRLYFPPHRSDLSIGFRCVKPWPPTPL